MMTGQSNDRPPKRLLDDQIEPFLTQLRNAGYAQRTLRKKRTVARAFARWAKSKRIVTRDLNSRHIAAFVARSLRRGRVWACGHAAFRWLSAPRGRAFGAC